MRRDRIFDLTTARKTVYRLYLPDQENPLSNNRTLDEHIAEREARIDIQRNQP